jgi:hypothetical protein
MDLVWRAVEVPGRRVKERERDWWRWHGNVVTRHG